MVGTNIAIVTASAKRALFSNDKFVLCGRLFCCCGACVERSVEWEKKTLVCRVKVQQKYCLGGEKETIFGAQGLFSVVHTNSSYFVVQSGYGKTADTIHEKVCPRKTSLFGLFRIIPIWTAPQPFLTLLRFYYLLHKCTVRSYQVNSQKNVKIIHVYSIRIIIVSWLKSDAYSNFKCWRHQINENKIEAHCCRR